MLLCCCSSSQRTSTFGKIARWPANRLHPILMSCAAEVCDDFSSSCWTFNGSCDPSDAILIPEECLLMKKGRSLVVTAFVSVRSDRTNEEWLNWIEKYATIPADVFAWLPKEQAHISETFRVYRKQYAEQFQTCIVKIAASQLPYGYTIPSIQKKFDRGLNLPSTWNYLSPEVTNPAYVPLQFSKIPSCMLCRAW